MLSEIAIRLMGYEVVHLREYPLSTQRGKHNHLPSTIFLLDDVADSVEQ